MTILVVGEGGREHAITWKLAQSARVDQIYAAPGSPGMAQLARCVDIAVNNFAGLAAFAQEKGIDLTVVGPEVPLAEGIVDHFQKLGLRIFGPTREAARIESDKDFALDLMHRHNIPTGDFRTCSNAEEARECIAEWGAPVVLKAIGLAAGKGVIICMTEEEALAAVDEILVDNAFGSAGDRCVIMEYLEGEEASIFGFTDGKDIVFLASAQDHKRIGEGDTGPNTGGMGAYAPPPLVTDELHDEIVNRIMIPTVKALQDEGCSYVGILYGGIICTKDGPKVIEFNCRLGDPEAQIVLPLLKSDLLDLIDACIDGTVADTIVDVDDRAAACVVLASEGYPVQYDIGHVISGMEAAEAMGDVFLFHAGTALKEGDIVTKGGRVLGVTAIGADVPEAIRRTYEAVEKIEFENRYFRKDIGYRALDRLATQA
jgi:phosphoribosylamine--glycine ligase